MKSSRPDQNTGGPSRLADMVRKGAAAEEGGGCDSQSAWIDISVFGTPTGGDFDLDWTFNGVEETITHDYNGNAANFATELAGHSEVASSDFDIVGGPLPNATIRVKLKGTQDNIDVSLPIADWTNLTGGLGVGVICSLAQKGHA